MLSKNKLSVKGFKSNIKAFSFLAVAAFILVVISLLSLSYAWIFATYFSDISGINISLENTQGLIMILNGDVTQSIDINSYLGGSLSTFALKEISSANGTNLYARDMNTYFDDTNEIYANTDVARDNVGIIKFRNIEESDYNKSFIYFNFVLQASGDDRYLIFDSDNSYLKYVNGTKINPIRLSLTFINGLESVTKIIGNRQEYLGNYVTKALTSIDADTKVGYTGNQNINSFEGYNGYNNGIFDSNKTLYFLPKDITINVVVRMWLEGGDPECVDSIAGSSLNISLKFDNIDASEVA